MVLRSFRALRHKDRERETASATGNRLLEEGVGFENKQESLTRDSAFAMITYCMPSRDKEVQRDY